MIGISACFDSFFFAGFAVVQTDCIAISLTAEKLRQKFNSSSEIQKLLLLYTHVLLNQLSQNIFCVCHHTIEQRLARLLLAYSHRLCIF